MPRFYELAVDSVSHEDNPLYIFQARVARGAMHELKGVL